MQARLLAATLAAALVASPALAGPIQMTTAVFKDVSTKSPSGAVAHALSPVTRAVPGQAVVLVLTVRNTGAASAEGLVINNPLARGLEYVGPREGPPPVVSVDGGKSFGSLPQLTVRGADGSVRPAQAGNVTDIRWVLPTAVPAGGEGHVAFAARVK